jgi:hypothetical protein
MLQKVTSNNKWKVFFPSRGHRSRTMMKWSVLSAHYIAVFIWKGIRKGVDYKYWHLACFKVLFLWYYSSWTVIYVPVAEDVSGSQRFLLWNVIVSQWLIFYTYALSESLWNVIKKLCPGEADPNSHPVIIYMRREVSGVKALEGTTLHSLGLTGGRAMLR